jgi:PadR family transcriptional regulator, regulatory protein PadR
MPAKSYPGEFEQMVLLAILQCGDAAFALEVRRKLEDSTGRTVSRGAFYTTLDRLERKGLLDWSLDSPADARAATELRRYRVTRAGVDALRASRAALMTLWRGLDVLKERA